MNAVALAALLGMVGAGICLVAGRPSPRLHRILCVEVAFLWFVILLLSLALGFSVRIRIRLPAPDAPAAIAPPAGV